MSFYDYSVQDIMGNTVNLERYRGKLIMVVNIASKCGFTPQLQGLENLYKKYHPSGLEILAFPCNQFMNQAPGSGEEEASFCSLNYGVTFPVFEKINVNGKEAHPLYGYLKEEQKGKVSKEIKWNFTKFLINTQGQVVARYAPTTSPEELENSIQRQLAEK